MPEFKTYDLSINHAWRFSDDYNSLVEIIKQASNLTWRNHKIHRDNPAIDPNSDASR